MKKLTYVMILVLLFGSIYLGNQYRDRKHYVDRNIKYQLSSTANIINNSMNDIGACLEYIELMEVDESLKNVYTPIIVDTLYSESKDIMDSYFGVILIREINPKIHVKLTNIIEGIERLAKKIENNNQISEDDIKDMQLLSEISLNSTTDSFYKREGLIANSVPEDWFFQQYSELSEIGLRIAK